MAERSVKGGDDQFNRLLYAWFGPMAEVFLPGHVFSTWGGYANLGNSPLGNSPPMLAAAKLSFLQGIVWDKEHPFLTRTDRTGSLVKRLCPAWRRGRILDPER